MTLKREERNGYKLLAIMTSNLSPETQSCLQKKRKKSLLGISQGFPTLLTTPLATVQQILWQVKYKEQEL